VPDAKALLDELREFRVDFTATRHMQCSARSGALDDLVLSLALAVWRARAGLGTDALSVMNFYRVQTAQEHKADKMPGGAKGKEDRLPWLENLSRTRSQ